MYCDKLKTSVPHHIWLLAICKYNYNPVTCYDGIRLVEHGYYIHCTTSIRSFIRLPYTPRYGSTTNTQAQQRERMIFCRGGDGEGKVGGKFLAALGFTCSRSGMIARTVLPLCRSCPGWSVALAEAPFTIYFSSSI